MGFGCLEHLLRVRTVVGHRNDGNHRVLPGIEPIDLRHRNVELIAEPVFQAAHDLAFVLERMRILNPKFEGQDPYARHEDRGE